MVGLTYGSRDVWRSQRSHYSRWGAGLPHTLCPTTEDHITNLQQYQSSSSDTCEERVKSEILELIGRERERLTEIEGMRGGRERQK